MVATVSWTLFVIPSIVLVVAWCKVRSHWREGHRSIAGIACLSLASGSALLGIGALARVYFVRPISRWNYSVETLGLCLSFAAVIAGFAVREKHKSRYFGLSLAAAAWLLLLFGLAASTY